jgi:hypothetical protein
VKRVKNSRNGGFISTVGAKIMFENGFFLGKNGCRWPAARIFLKLLKKACTETKSCVIIIVEFKGGKEKIKRRNKSAK